MAESQIIRTKRDAQILHYDLASVHTYTVSREAGDFQVDAPGEAVSLFLARGVISDIPDIRYGDEQPITFGYSAHLRDLGDTDADPAYATLPDLCFRYRGKYVDRYWISTTWGYSDVFTVGTNYTLDGSAFGEADKTMTLPHCVIRGGFQEGDPSTINVTGTAYSCRPILT